MNPTEIMNVLKQKNQLLTQKNDEYILLSQKRALAEQEYKIAYAKEMLRLKTEGNAITIIRDLVSGNKGVAGLKFQYEVAAAIEKANLESMKDVREAIGSARSILTWLRSELESR